MSLVLIIMINVDAIPCQGKMKLSTKKTENDPLRKFSQQRNREAFPAHMKDGAMFCCCVK